LSFGAMSADRIALALAVLEKEAGRIECGLAIRRYVRSKQ
jgi:hypothetical protein